MKVAAFSAVENVAELLGYGLRTSVLAPPVGEPTGDEPDASTTMYDARLDGGMVFVWTGGASPAEPAATLSPLPSDSTAITGTIRVRSPHASVAEALLVNPGSALGLGALLGAGDELCSPTISSEEGVITVRRERYTYDLPRASSFGPLSKRESTTTISTVAETGFTRVDVAGGRWAPRRHVTVGLTPIDAHRTVVRWRLSLDGFARQLYSTGATTWTSGRRLAGRASDAAEALADSMPKSVDPGVLALRQSRAR